MQVVDAVPRNTGTNSPWQTSEEYQSLPQESKRCTLTMIENKKPTANKKRIMAELYHNATCRALLHAPVSSPQK